MAEQIEALEHHSNLFTLAGNITLAHLVQLLAALPIAHQVAVDPDPPGVDLFKVVDAAQKGRLPRARRA